MYGVYICVVIYKYKLYTVRLLTVEKRDTKTGIEWGRVVSCFHLRPYTTCQVHCPYIKCLVYYSCTSDMIWMVDNTDQSASWQEEILNL